MVHVPLDRDGLDLTLHRPVQLDLDETSALDTQLAVIEQSAAIAVGRKGTLGWAGRAYLRPQPFSS